VHGISEFREALERYMHLLRGGRVDVAKAVEVEEIELNLIGELAAALPDPPATAHEALTRLASTGWLWNAIRKVGERIGDEPRDPETALKAFLSGNLEEPGAKAALIVAQAVARHVAESRLARNGVHEEITPRCPVCGAESKTMVVKRDGYYMVCHFCAYEWRISRTGRMVCPYCGSDNPVSIGVFTDRRRRIGLFVCQDCGATWRGRARQEHQGPQDPPPPHRPRSRGLQGLPRLQHRPP